MERIGTRALRVRTRAGSQKAGATPAPGGEEGEQQALVAAPAGAEGAGGAAGAEAARHDSAKGGRGGSGRGRSDTVAAKRGKSDEGL